MNPIRRPRAQLAILTIGLAVAMPACFPDAANQQKKGLGQNGDPARGTPDSDPNTSPDGTDAHHPSPLCGLLSQAVAECFANHAPPGPPPCEDGTNCLPPGFPCEDGSIDPDGNCHPPFPEPICEDGSPLGPDGVCHGGGPDGQPPGSPCADGTPADPDGNCHGGGPDAPPPCDGIDPTTGLPIDCEDPANPTPCDDIDPNTGLPIDCAEPSEPPCDDVIDPNTGLPVDCGHPVEPPHCGDIDPTTGLPIDCHEPPHCGDIDPTTGLPIDCIPPPEPEHPCIQLIEVMERLCFDPNGPGYPF